MSRVIFSCSSMSGNDLIAIFCLLLAGGGFAYLVRTGRKVKAGPPTGDVDDKPSRTAQTIPPKLRSSSSLPPRRAEEPPSAPAPKPDPSTPTLETEKKPEGKRNPSSFTALPVKATLVSSGADEIAKVAEGAAAKKVDVTTVPATPAASAAKAPPPASTPKPDPKKPDPKKPDPKAPDPKKPVKPPAPSSRSAIPAAKVTPKTTIVAGSNAPLPEPTKKKDVLADIPKLSVEDDDDIEPTKVGKLAARREIQPPVEKHVVDAGADEDASPVAKPMQVAYAIAQTDPGRRRKQNEDSYLLLEKEGVFVVADGMGGHRGGQIASQLAVKTIGDAFETKKFEAAAHIELPPAASELARSMQMANAAIQEEAKVQPDLKGMGTTLVAARFTADRQRLYVGHVGDSRCYRIRDGVMKQITTDHTMADYGVAGPEGAHLSRAVGVWPTVPIDVLLAAPQLGDTYLICSDGLTKMLTNETIATQIVHEDDPKAAVNRLVMFANAHGGKDNITVILIRIVAPDWKPPG